MNNGLINRQAAIDELEERLRANGSSNVVLVSELNRCIGYIMRLPSADAVEVVRCKDCRWGREVCGNIECFVDSNIPPEYHGYEWFCPNGDRRNGE